MSTIFRGDFTKIRKHVRRVDSAGHWRDLDHGGKQYRTDAGAVLNWWEKSGKIVFQGNGDAALKFEQAFKALALRSKRLTHGNGSAARTVTKEPGPLAKENKTLRALIADKMIENARLRKRLKRARASE